MTRLPRQGLLYRAICLLTLTAFLFLSLVPSQALAQGALLGLPQPGVMVMPGPSFTPALLRGLQVYPDNPLRFDFIIDTGDTGLEGDAFEAEAQKLIKYFLASVTIPEDEFWVNLSPYEQDRIIAHALGQAEMGRDLLAQDYMLKQLTATLIHPDHELGKKFWQRVYQRSYELYGTTQMPANTFNKIWIVPDEAVVYEQDTYAFVGERHLKVMLEEDYLSMENNASRRDLGMADVDNEEMKKIAQVSSEIVREVLLPEIEQEVNHGKIFANLRQIFDAMILATWYKKALKDSLLGQVYADKNKIKGVDVEDKTIKDQIYDQYLETFKKGVCDLVKVEKDIATDKFIPRKYFSGGVSSGILTREGLKKWGEALVVRPARWLGRNVRKLFDPLGKGQVRMVATGFDEAGAEVVSPVAEQTGVPAMLQEGSSVSLNQEWKNALEAYDMTYQQIKEGVVRIVFTRGDEFKVVNIFGEKIKQGEDQKEYFKNRIREVLDFEEITSNFALFPNYDLKPGRDWFQWRILKVSGVRLEAHVGFINGQPYLFKKGDTLEEGLKKINSLYYGKESEQHNQGFGRQGEQAEYVEQRISEIFEPLREEFQNQNQDSPKVEGPGGWHTRRTGLDERLRMLPQPTVESLLVKMIEDVKGRKDVVEFLKNFNDVFYYFSRNKEIFRERIEGKGEGGWAEIPIVDHNGQSKIVYFDAVTIYEGALLRVLEAAINNIKTDQDRQNFVKYVENLLGEDDVNVPLAPSFVKPVVSPSRTIPIISSEAYNAFSEPGVQQAIEQGLIENPEVKRVVKQKKERGITGQSFQKYVEKLRFWGQQAEVSGASVYYPFGGVDPFVPFTVVDGVEDVFSMGGENFGSPEDIISFSYNASPYDKSGYQFDRFDSARDMHMFSYGSRISGIGPMAIVRILHFLEGKIEKIAYFDIQENGNLTYLSESEVKNKKNCRNAVVEFISQDPQTGKELKRRFWYIQHNVFDGIFMDYQAKDKSLDPKALREDLLRSGYINQEGIVQSKITEGFKSFNIPSFLTISESLKRSVYDVLLKSYQDHLGYYNFVKQLKFQTMLIKAANKMWDHDEADGKEDGYNPMGYSRNLYSTTLEPAIENEARIISDNRSDGWGSRKGFAPHSIWKEIPKSIPVSEGEQFGYSSEGDYIYYGSADNLVNLSRFASSTILSEKINAKELPGITQDLILSMFLRDVDFLKKAAQYIHDAYYNGIGEKPPVFLSQDASPGEVNNALGQNLPGFFAFLEAIVSISIQADQTPFEVLDSIVNNEMSEDHLGMIQAAMIAHATWLTSQPFRSIERMQRPVVMVWRLLSSEEKKKDLVQIKAAAEFFSKELKSVLQRVEQEQDRSGVVAKANQVLSDMLEGSDVSEKDRASIKKAVETIMFFHRNQDRKDGKEFSLHPILVMEINRKMFGNIDPLMDIVSLFHDAREDQLAYYEALKNYAAFKLSRLSEGPEKEAKVQRESFLRLAIRLLSKLEGEKYAGFEDPESEYFRRLKQPREIFAPWDGQTWYTDAFVRGVQTIKMSDVIMNWGDLKTIFDKAELSEDDRTLPDRFFSKIINKMIPIMVEGSQVLTNQDRQRFYSALISKTNEYINELQGEKRYALLVDAAREALPKLEAFAQGVSAGSAITVQEAKNDLEAILKEYVSFLIQKDGKELLEIFQEKKESFTMESLKSFIEVDVRAVLSDLGQKKNLENRNDIEFVKYLVDQLTQNMEKNIIITKKIKNDIFVPFLERMRERLGGAYKEVQGWQRLSLSQLLRGLDGWANWLDKIADENEIKSLGSGETQRQSAIEMRTKWAEIFSLMEREGLVFEQETPEAVRQAAVLLQNIDLLEQYPLLLGNKIGFLNAKADLNPDPSSLYYYERKAEALIGENAKSKDPSVIIEDLRDHYLSAVANAIFLHIKRGIEDDAPGTSLAWLSKALGTEYSLRDRLWDHFRDVYLRLEQREQSVGETLYNAQRVVTNVIEKNRDKIEKAPGPKEAAQILENVLAQVAGSAITVEEAIDKIKSTILNKERGYFFNRTYLNKVAKSLDQCWTFEDVYDVLQPLITALGGFINNRNRSFQGGFSPEQREKMIPIAKKVLSDLYTINSEDIVPNIAGSGDFVSETKKEPDVGGIDLGITSSALQIRRDGGGMPLPLNQQSLEFQNIEGFTPFIINVMPFNPAGLISQIEDAIQTADAG